MLNNFEIGYLLKTENKTNKEQHEDETDLIREEILAEFLKKGVLQKEDDNWIFDKEMLKLNPININKRISSKNGKTRFLTGKLIYEKLENLEAIDSSRWKEKQEKPEIELEKKPLFNVPESADEVFDLEKISSKKYYLNFWDIYKKRGSNLKQKIKAKNGDEISLSEFILVTKIFRDFSGKRESDGSLTVFDPQKHERGKISVNFISENVGQFIDGGNNIYSIHAFLKNRCPNIINKGLLRFDDFGIKTESSSGIFRRKEKRLGDNSSSSVSFAGAQYYIGRNYFEFNGKKYPNKNIKIVLLDQQTGGVIVIDKDREKLICVFNFLSQEEKTEKYRQLEEREKRRMTLTELTPRTSVKEKEMHERLRPWILSNEVQKFKEETTDEYVQRLLNISDYNYLNEITSEFLKEAKIGIHNLTWREQQWLVAAVFELNVQGKKEKIFDFSKKFGLEGLKSFLTCEFNLENGEKILKIGEQLDSREAEKVFIKISQLVDLAQEKNEELKRIILKDNQKEIPNNVRAELLRKAHNIVIRFSEELEKGGKVDDEAIQKLLAELEQSRIEIDLIASLLLAAKKQGEFQELEDIKGIEIKELAGDKLFGDKMLLDKLREMYETANMHKSKEDLARLVQDFEKHLKYDPKFYLLYFDKDGQDGASKNLDNLVGFVRSSAFDGQKELGAGERYLGAFNVDPLLRRFYLSENFSKETNEKEIAAGVKKLIAHLPENGASHKILKRLGFVDAAVEGEYKDDDGKTIAKRIRVELTKE